jgi:pimeloyl-ACP methyl ester carboxylesterase
MRARRWCIVALLVVVTAACGNNGNETAQLIGNDISFDVPVARGDAQTIRLQGVERGSGPVGVVLAHMLGSSQGAWAPLVEQLAKDEFHLLTFDFRGHGISEGDRDPSHADLDLAGAIAKLRSLGASRVLVVGASMGGTAALAVARQQDLAGVVTMSAPLEIGGLDASSGVHSYHGPLLVIVGANDDRRYTDAADAIVAASPAAPKRLVRIRGSAHGTDLLVDKAEGARVRRLILDFLESHRG